MGAIKLEVRNRGEKGRKYRDRREEKRMRRENGQE